MKKSKKIKLITSLSSLAITGTAVATVATGCNSLSPEKPVDDDLGTSESNGTIDVTSISWVKRSKYDSNDTGILKTVVKNDNSTVFAKYRGLEEVMSIDVAYDESASDPITVKLTNSGANKRYTGALAADPIKWTAKYSAQPTPTPPEPSQITQVRYTELVGLKSAGLLEPGRQYQITDYVTTVDHGTEYNKGNYYGKAIACSQLSTFFPRVGDYYNPKFDLIVTATSKTTISDTASVVKNISDVYFPSFTKFSAWTVKYCLENDTEKYDWATDNGKGVIYYMKDEFGNEAPYDFKSVLFLGEHRWTNEKIPFFTFNYDDENNDLIDASIWVEKEYSPYTLNSPNGYIGSYVPSNVRNNVIKTYIESNVQKLNCNIFNGVECNNNELAENCYGNTFRKGSADNKFGTGCSNNDFGMNFQGNIFGNYCCNNYVQGDFQWNTFGNNCCNNQIFNVDNEYEPEPLQNNNTFDNGVSNITIEPVQFDYNHVHFTIGSSFCQPANNLTFTNGIPEGVSEYYSVGPITWTANNINTVVRSPLKLMNMGVEVEPQPDMGYWEFRTLSMDYTSGWNYVQDYDGETTLTIPTTSYGTARINLWQDGTIICSRTINLDKLPQYTIKGLENDEKIYNAFYGKETRSEPLELYYGDEKVETKDLRFKITGQDEGLNASIDPETNQIVYRNPSTYGEYIGFGLAAYIDDERVFMTNVSTTVWNLEAKPIWGKSGNDEGPYVGDSSNYISFMQYEGYADEIFSLSSGDTITWNQALSSEEVTSVTFPSYGEKAAAMKVSIAEGTALGTKVEIALTLHLDSYGIDIDTGFTTRVIDIPYMIDNVSWEKDNGLVIVGRDNISTEGLKLYKGEQEVSGVRFEINDARTTSGLKRHVTIEENTNKLVLTDPQVPPTYDEDTNGEAVDVNSPVIAVNAYWTDPSSHKEMSHMEALPVSVQHTECSITWGKEEYGPKPGSENEYSFTFQNTSYGAVECGIEAATNPNIQWSDNINSVSLTQKGIKVSVKDVTDDLDAFIKMDIQYYDRTSKEWAPIGDPITTTYNFKINVNGAYDIVAPNGLEEIYTEDYEGIQLSVTQDDQVLELKNPKWTVDSTKLVKKESNAMATFVFDENYPGLLIPAFQDPAVSGNTYEVTVSVVDTTGTIPQQITKTFTITIGDRWMENPYDINENCLVDLPTSTVTMISNESDAYFSIVDVSKAVTTEEVTYALAEEIEGIEVATYAVTVGEETAQCARIKVSKDLAPGEHTVGINLLDADEKVIGTRTFNIIVPDTGNSADRGFVTISTAETDMQAFLDDTEEMAKIPYSMTVDLNSEVQIYNLLTYVKPVSILRGLVMQFMEEKLPEGLSLNLAWITTSDTIYIEFMLYMRDEKTGSVMYEGYKFNFYNYHDWTQYGMYEGAMVGYNGTSTSEPTSTAAKGKFSTLRVGDLLCEMRYERIDSETRAVPLPIPKVDFSNITFIHN